MKSKYIITLLLSLLLTPAFSQTHKEELTARVKEYYIVEASSYPSKEAHVKALEPYIIPTKEGHEYAEYVAETWIRHHNRYGNIQGYSMRTRIVSISPGENDKTGIVITEDIDMFNDKPFTTTTSTSEWVYYKKQWYRSAKRSIQSYR